jgi:phosphodiesterase/alkaline phosphatase D-like protein
LYAGQRVFGCDRQGDPMLTRRQVLTGAAVTTGAVLLPATAASAHNDHDHDHGNPATPFALGVASAPPTRRTTSTCRSART